MSDSDNSSSNISISSRERRAQQRRDGEFGMPCRWFCGGAAVIATSFTGTNPGRRFYTCERSNDGGCHIWKWWDEAMMDEFSEMKRDILDLESRMRYFCLGDDDELVDPPLMWRNIRFHRDEICQLKELFEKIDGKLKQLEEIVVKRSENFNEMKLMVGFGLVVMVVALIVSLFV